MHCVPVREVRKKILKENQQVHLVHQAPQAHLNLNLVALWVL